MRIFAVALPILPAAMQLGPIHPLALTATEDQRSAVQTAAHADLVLHRHRNEWGAGSQ
jgi:hypothetical protein